MEEIVYKDFVVTNLNIIKFNKVKEKHFELFIEIKVNRKKDTNDAYTYELGLVHKERTLKKIKAWRLVTNSHNNIYTCYWCEKKERRPYRIANHSCALFDDFTEKDRMAFAKLVTESPRVRLDLIFKMEQ